MQKKSTHSVPYNEHPCPSEDLRLNWENIHVFLEVAESRSFRAAAKKLNMAINTARRHVDLLEHAIGNTLLIRHVGGADMTPEGRQLRNAASQMQDGLYDVQRCVRKDSDQLSGRVKISATEGIGIFWLTPRLVEFQRSHPLLLIEINCTMRKADLNRLEADISIQLERPENPDLKMAKLGYLHIMPFASLEYLQTFGYPKTLKDLERHKIVEQLSPQIESNAIDRLFPGKAREGFVSIATNTSSSHYWAVAKGAGIGMLPTYVWSVGARIEPVDIGLYVKHEIWMVYHPGSKNIKRINTTINWLKQAFDPKLFPWFREEFIPPSELENMQTDKARINMFEGFIGR